MSRMPERSARLEGMGTEPWGVRGSAPRRAGEQHHTGGSGGIGAVGGGVAVPDQSGAEDARSQVSGRAACASSESEGEESIQRGSSSSEVQWRVPRSGVLVEDVEDDASDDDAVQFAVAPSPPRRTAALRAKANPQSGEIKRLQEENEKLRLEREKLRLEKEKLKLKEEATTELLLEVTRDRGVKERPMGKGALGDEMSGVGELGGSVSIRPDLNGKDTGKPKAARRLPMLPDAAQRPRDHPQVKEVSTRGRPVEVPTKQRVSQERSMKEWLQRSEAARRENHRALRGMTSEGSDEEVMGETTGWDTGEGSAWEEWEKKGGPYMEKRGPVGGQRKGAVRLALEERDREDRRDVPRGRDKEPRKDREYRGRRDSASSERGYKPPRKPTKPDKFDGTTSVDAFLEQFHTCARYNRWDREDKYVHLKLCLKGSAAGLLRDCREDGLTFDVLEEKLRQRFDAKGREAAFRAQLKARKRRRGESLQELYISVGELLHQAYPGRSSEHKDTIACSAFIDALDDPALEQRVSDKDPKDLDDAYRLAVTMEANTRGAEVRHVHE